VSQVALPKSPSVIRDIEQVLPLNALRLHGMSHAGPRACECAEYRKLFSDEAITSLFRGDYNRHDNCWVTALGVTSSAASVPPASLRAVPSGVLFGNRSLGKTTCLASVTCWPATMEAHLYRIEPTILNVVCNV
jgi:hypothetical protein